MNHPTDSYRALRVSLSRVRKLLARVPFDRCVSQLDHLKIQAFILLSHAAFEEYLEELSKSVARAAVNDCRGTGRISKVILALVSQEAILQVKHRDEPRKKVAVDSVADIPRFASVAAANLFRDIEKNHGIKIENQENLLLPIGINPEDFIEVSAAMDALGSKRGNVAHRSVIRVEDTRSSILHTVDQILRDLRELDKQACRNLSL
ncbi:hypothetical protein KBY27_04855 [Ruegeria pomeroyi]|uniref:RiboL-PSP-HEPN domain-containing protein n=1 Tax=Ruegeria pomeroyi TaxID=89184 RepID=A0A9Q3WJ53_9RHOB|nr:HEPN domain-containing protein [Ruegeria pomeroyi]MCE8536779.1 hypothetical protein [Ruegeria pomeroyi]